VFSLGGTELLIVVIVALLLFGPDKIPQMARTIGRFTREFNKYKDIMESTVRAEIYKADTETEAPVEDEPVLTPEQRIAKAAAAANEVRAKRAAEVAAAESASKAAETDEEDEEEEE
jgi:Tat protein translocase TatB subunit